MNKTIKYLSIVIGTAFLITLILGLFNEKEYFSDDVTNIKNNIKDEGKLKTLSTNTDAGERIKKFILAIQKESESYEKQITPYEKDLYPENFVNNQEVLTKSIESHKNIIQILETQLRNNDVFFQNNYDTVYAGTNTSVDKDLVDSIGKASNEIIIKRIEYNKAGLILYTFISNNINGIDEEDGSMVVDDDIFEEYSFLENQYQEKYNSFLKEVEKLMKLGKGDDY